MVDPSGTTSHRRQVITAIQLVLVSCAFFALIWVAFKLYGYAQAQQYYKDIQRAYATENSIDFSALITEYPNAVAWIRVDDLPEIDYPIMQTDNNDFYLHNDPAGDPSIDGSIFLDHRNTNVATNLHAIVYGHNMRDGSMFGSLKSFTDEGFYKSGDGMFTIYTPAGTYRYQIFAVNIVDPSSETFMVGFTDGTVFSSFVNMLKESSMYDTGVEVNGTDQIVTLSTCSDSNRLVVSAKRVSGRA